MACATSVVKCIVFLFNLICALAGLTFIALGVLYKLSFDQYTKAATENAIVVAPILAIVIGSIIFVIAFFGCCGAVRESSCLLTTYSIILLAMFILQVALGVYAFLQFKDSQTGVKTEFKGALSEVFQKLNENTENAQLVNALQQGFQCCGIDGPDDWLIKWQSPIAPSCCNNNAAPCSRTSAYETGCFNTLWSYLQKSAEIIGIVVICIGALEIVAATMALCLASSIRNQERRGYY